VFSLFDWDRLVSFGRWSGGSAEHGQVHPYIWGWLTIGSSRIALAGTQVGFAGFYVIHSPTCQPRYVLLVVVEIFKLTSSKIKQNKKYSTHPNEGIRQSLTKYVDMLEGDSS
jgi:hypothetical protein